MLHCVTVLSLSLSPFPLPQIWIAPYFPMPPTVTLNFIGNRGAGDYTTDFGQVYRQSVTLTRDAPTPQPTNSPTLAPSALSASPTLAPTPPTPAPSAAPIAAMPSAVPSAVPSAMPSETTTTSAPTNSVAGAPTEGGGGSQAVATDESETAMDEDEMTALLIVAGVLSSLACAVLLLVIVGGVVAMSILRRRQTQPQRRAAGSLATHDAMKNRKSDDAAINLPETRLRASGVAAALQRIRASVVGKQRRQHAFEMQSIDESEDGSSSRSLGQMSEGAYGFATTSAASPGASTRTSGAGAAASSSTQHGAMASNPMKQQGRTALPAATAASGNLGPRRFTFADEQRGTDGETHTYTRAEFLADFGEVAGAAEWNNAGEHRKDETTGGWYTQAQFRAHYGGLKEWNRARGTVGGGGAIEKRSSIRRDPHRVSTAHGI